MRDDVTPGRIRLARAIAVVADALQLGLFPLFLEGYLSPINDVVDLVVCAVLVWLVGWHWAFLPGVAAEAVPALNLAPTWTAAVFFATRKGAPPPSAVVDAEARALPADDNAPHQ